MFVSVCNDVIVQIYAADVHNQEFSKEYFIKLTFQNVSAQVVGHKLSSVRLQLKVHTLFTIFRFHQRASRQERGAL